MSGMGASGLAEVQEIFESDSTLIEEERPQAADGDHHLVVIGGNQRPDTGSHTALAVAGTPSSPCAAAPQLDPHDSKSTQETGVIASLFLRVAAASIVAVAPRPVALLIVDHAVSKVPAAQAVADFNAMWAPCKDPANYFPAYSPQGQFYHWLLGTDAFFLILGVTLAGTGFLHAQFSAWNPGQQGRGRQRGLCTPLSCY